MIISIVHGRHCDNDYTNRYGYTEQNKQRLPLPHLWSFLRL